MGGVAVQVKRQVAVSTSEAVGRREAPVGGPELADGVDRVHARSGAASGKYGRCRGVGDAVGRDQSGVGRCRDTEAVTGHAGAGAVAVKLTCTLLPVAMLQELIRMNVTLVVVAAATVEPGLQAPDDVGQPANRSSGRSPARPTASR